MKLNTDKIRIEAHENYQKRSIRNKTTIMAANGPLKLSVPLVKGKTQTKIKSVEISYDEPWPEYHLKTIKSAYGSSPFIEFYLDDISQIILKRYKYLFDLNIGILNYFKRIGLIDEYLLTHEYVSHLPPNDNYRKSNYKWSSTEELYTYNQVFEDKYGFVSGMSILDLIFNQGPAARIILDQ